MQYLLAIYIMYSLLFTESLNIHVIHSQVLIPIQTHTELI